MEHMVLTKGLSMKWHIYSFNGIIPQKMHGIYYFKKNQLHLSPKITNNVFVKLYTHCIYSV